MYACSHIMDTGSIHYSKYMFIDWCSLCNFYHIMWFTGIFSLWTSSESHEKHIFNHEGKNYASTLVIILSSDTGFSNSVSEIHVQAAYTVGGHSVNAGLIQRAILGCQLYRPTLSLRIWWSLIWEDCNRSPICFPAQASDVQTHACAESSCPADGWWSC